MSGPAHPRSRGENMVSVLSVCRLGGSSPLTRGKLTLDDPAHIMRVAHPRSRGENAQGSDPVRGASGSSPLTRGKRIGVSGFMVSVRLIPAHAGKTTASSQTVVNSAAHPRSRGENQGWVWRDVHASGSSPLTRGKLDDDVRRGEEARLIPAHAGKTVTRCHARCHARAHPRSRGENLAAAWRARWRAGSSPLTRGKL